MTLKARLVAYAPNGPRTGQLASPLSWDATLTVSDHGSLSMTYSALSAGAQYLDRRIEQGIEVAVEVARVGTNTWVEPDGARFVVTDVEDDLLDGMRVQRFTGQSIGWMTSKIVSLTTDGLIPAGQENEGTRPWLDATPGHIVRTYLQEYEAGGSGYTWNRTFTHLVDSSGQAWAKRITDYFPHQIRLDVVLDNLVNGDHLDYTTRGRALYLANPASGGDRVGPLAPDHSTTVAYHLGSHVTAAPSKRSINDLVTEMGFDGGEGLKVIERNVSGPKPWGVWQGAHSDQNVTTTGTARAYLQTSLREYSRTRAQYVRDLAPVMPADAKLPFLDFPVGAWIHAPGASKTPERLRVVQAVLRNDSGRTTVGLVLNDVFMDRALRRARRQGGVIGGAGPSDGTNPVRPPTPPGPDGRTPAKVQGLVVASDTYEIRGEARSTVTLNWGAVTTATDGTAMSMQSYVIERRQDVRGAEWRRARYTNSSAATWTFDLEMPGQSWWWRVAAVGEGTKLATGQGAFSDPVQHTNAVYVVPPPVPSAPILTTNLGVITVKWDGRTEGNTQMPGSFRRVEIAMTSNAVSTPPDVAVIDTLPAGGTRPVADQTPGQQRYFWFRSVGVGGKSAWSARRNIATELRVDTDYIQGLIDGADIEPGSINAADKIIGNTITGDLMQANTLKTGHLDFNEMWGNSAFLGAARIGVLTVGGIPANRLGFGTDEINPNQMWQDSELRGRFPATGAGFSYSTGTSSSSLDGQSHVIFVNGPQASNGQLMNLTDYFPAAPGEKFWVEITGYRTSGNFNVNAQIVFRRADGSTTSASASLTSSMAANSRHVAHAYITAPTGSVDAYLRLTASNNPSSSAWYINKVSARRAMMSGGTVGKGSEIYPGGQRFWNDEGRVWWDINTDTQELSLSNGTFIARRNDNTNYVGMFPPAPTGSGGNPNPRIELSGGGMLSPATLEVGSGGNGLVVLRSGTLNGNPDSAYRLRLSQGDWGINPAAPGIQNRYGIGGNADSLLMSARNSLMLETYPTDSSANSRIDLYANPNHPQTFPQITAGMGTEGMYVMLYAKSGSAPAALSVDSNRILYRSQSLRELKLDIEDAAFDIADLRQLRPVTYKDRGQVERGENAQTYTGLVAEEVDAIPGLRALVTRDPITEELVGVSYDRIPLAFIPWHLRHDERDDATDARVTALEETVANLTRTLTALTRKK